MLDQLELLNFNHNFSPVFSSNERRFILKTCQRTIVLSLKPISLKNHPQENKFTYLKGRDAYRFLLEITCGLQSKLIGENEIVAQVKDAYREYISQGQVDSEMLKILEKLFQDTKKVRTKYLIGLGQKTYASITRRKMINDAGAKQVVIFGSGKLAEDLINQFKKKCQVFVCARNSQRVLELTSKHNIESLKWENRGQTHHFPFLINTIGSDFSPFQNDYFELWEKHSHKRFIDLAHPSPFSANEKKHNDFIDLEAIMKEGVVKEKEKIEKLQLAQTAMGEIVQRRAESFMIKTYSDKKTEQYVQSI